VRRRLIAVPAALVLVGPTVLAFESGAYFEGPRVWAGMLAWAAVILALALGAAPPRRRGARLALGGLTLLAGWTLASIIWAPIEGNAYQASQIVVLYLGALLAAALVLREPLAQRLAEPVLALGATVVIGYGLAGRLLPGILHYARSVSAQGRLEQPLTYWNAMGELAALGLVLAARLAGDGSRPRAVRTLAAAAGAPLGLGVYTSFSRGALFAAAAGLIALVALAPRRQALTGLLITALAGVLAAVLASPLHGVTGLRGTLAHREHEGLVVLLVVLALAGLAAAAQRRAVARGSDGPLGGGALFAHRGAAATAFIAVGLALAVVLGAKETSAGPQALSGGATRLVSLRSNRYDYWDVALRAFASEPLHGVGAGNWQVYWLRWRPIQEFAADAHSLPLQTLAELGVIGALALAAFLLGVLDAARRVARTTAGAAAGPAAGCVAYLAHAPLDWDWEMPAVTLVAIALAGSLLAQAEGGIQR
jgi:hypothetical protein